MRITIHEPTDRGSQPKNTRICQRAKAPTLTEAEETMRALLASVAWPAYAQIDTGYSLRIYDARGALILEVPN